MKLNPVELAILEVIENDIKKTGKGFSYLTNNEISKELGISVFSIRDKILKLAEKKAIVKRNDVWDTDKKYHNRIIYLK